MDLGEMGEAGVYADPGQLEQVLVNLALNARDAMPHGGELRFSTRLEVVPPEVAQYHLGFELPFHPFALLAVGDTGSGMDAETLAHAFDPFFTTKPAGKGSGLGLATVYGIVKQSGGYIWAESDPGRGTTFTVGFPTVHLSGEHPVLPETALVGGNARILVVDDEPAVRQLAGRMLGRLGYEVIEAPSAPEALRLVKEVAPDAVLSDVMMPGMDGRELREWLRGQHPDLPVILMSGHPASEALRQGNPEAGEVWITKPFSLATLASHLQQALASRPVPKP
jgi:two-component system cell cycle sensor histidine kinase/response regulator CckA